MGFHGGLLLPGEASVGTDIRDLRQKLFFFLHISEQQKKSHVNLAKLVWGSGVQTGTFASPSLALFVNPSIRLSVSILLIL